MLPEPFHLLPSSALRSIKLERGAYVFQQNDLTKALYYVGSGSVTLRRTTETGVLITVYRAEPGSFFAEASLFSDTYHCDAICSDRTEIVAISKDVAMGYLETNANFAVGFSALLARQVQSYRHQMEVNAIRSAPDRVFAAVSSGMLTGSVMQLSQRLGLTHEATYRALAKLVRDGRLRKLGRGRYGFGSSSNPP